MDKEQRTLLTRRLRVAIEKQPEIRTLRRILLRIGGVEFVAPFGFDPDVSSLIDAGSEMSGLVKYQIMERSACHANVAQLWVSESSGLTAIGTGYALSEDGLWRQHSWGMCLDGIVETTKVRVKYFGICVQRGDAEAFIAANLEAEH